MSATALFSRFPAVSLIESIINMAATIAAIVLAAFTGRGHAAEESH